MATLYAYRTIDLTANDGPSLAGTEIVEFTNVRYEVASVEDRSERVVIYGWFGGYPASFDSVYAFDGDNTVLKILDLDLVFYNEQQIFDATRSAADANRPFEIFLDGQDSLFGSQEADTLDGGAGNDEIHGGDGSDDLFGSSGNDTIFGGAGDDYIFGEAGSDWIGGGPGFDRAVFYGPENEYRISVGRDKITVRDLVYNETDTVRAVEELEFTRGDGLDDNVIYQVKNLTGGLALPQEAFSTFVEMYIAYFDRAPDAFGLLYWGSRLADGMTLPEIAASFFVQPESQKLYSNPNDNAKLVDSAYSNLLERTPDAEGRAYWIDALNNGDVSRAEFMLALINGARAPTGSPADLRVIEDKADIGLYYAGIHGLTNVARAKNVMSVYDRDSPDTSLDNAQSLIETYSENALDGVGGFEVTVPMVGVLDDPFN